MEEAIRPGYWNRLANRLYGLRALSFPNLTAEAAVLHATEPLPSNRREVFIFTIIVNPFGRLANQFDSYRNVEAMTFDKREQSK